MPLPTDHPLRFELNDEAHARPPEALVPPQRITFLALLSDWAQREREWQHVVRAGPPVRRRAAAGRREPLQRRLRAVPAEVGAPLRVHALQVHRPLAGTRTRSREPAIGVVPAGWLAGVPGQIIVGFHVALAACRRFADRAGRRSPSRWFDGNALVGAEVAGGAAVALSDFRIHADGFSRLVVFDRSLAPRQAGRTVQRLLELDTYRVLALLALPLARETAPFLTRQEMELAQITKTMTVGPRARTSRSCSTG